MPTFYKYAERTANSQLNWGEIGKSMSQTLADASKLREDKRTEIDAATNKLNETLVNAPRGEDANGNAFTLQYADDATKYILMINKLLKSGDMDVRQYTTNMANITSNTTTAFKVQNEFQAQVKSLRERSASNDPTNKSQQLESDYNNYLKTFGDLSNSRLVISPTNGNVTVSKVDPNDPTKMLPQSMTIGDLWKGATMKFDYYDSQKSTSQIASGIVSKVIASVTEGNASTEIGKITTVDDALDNAATKKAIEDFVKAQTANPYNSTSILTQDIGGYQSVFLKSEHDKMSPEQKEEVIFYDNSKGYPNPILTEKQKNKAQAYLQTQIEAKVKRDEKITTFESEQSIRNRADQTALSKANTLAEEKRKNDLLNPPSTHLKEKWNLNLQQRLNENDIIKGSKMITGKEFKESLNKIPGVNAYKIKEETFPIKNLGNPTTHRITLYAPSDPTVKKEINWDNIPTGAQLTEIRQFMSAYLPGKDQTEAISTLSSLDKGHNLPELESVYKGVDKRGNAIYE